MLSNETNNEHSSATWDFGPDCSPEMALATAHTEIQQASMLIEATLYLLKANDLLQEDRLRLIHTIEHQNGNIRSMLFAIRRYLDGLPEK